MRHLFSTKVRVLLIVAVLLTACAGPKDVYEHAQTLLSKGDYAAAAEKFESLGSYEDAKLRVSANEDNWLQKIYHNAWLDMDLGDYDSVIEALDALQGVELPKRYAELNDMYSEACLARADELIEMGKPLDALPILERIPESKTAQKRLDAYKGHR